MPEVVSKATAAKKRKEEKELKTVMIKVVDFNSKDVVKFDKEGRELYFDDSKEGFLKLDPKVVSKLKPSNKQRYRLAEQIFKGEDVIQTVQDGIRGWAKDYNVRPGSFSDNLAVFGKRQDFDYVWSTPAKMNNKIAKGWEIDHDPNVRTIWDDNGTLKTVGGEAKPEQVLMRRPKKISLGERKKRKEKTEKLLGRTKEKFVKSAAEIGVTATIED